MKNRDLKFQELKSGTRILLKT